MKRFDTKAMVTLGVLAAMEIILSRFLSISAWNIKIGFSFIPIAAASILYGPLGGGAVGALGDFAGAVLFPIGPYFPGFTLTAFLTGTTFGLLLYKRQSATRIMGAVVVNQLAWSLLLQSLWISVLYRSPYLPLLAARLGQCMILLPLQFGVIGYMSKTVGHYSRRVPA